MLSVFKTNSQKHRRSSRTPKTPASQFDKLFSKLSIKQSPVTKLKKSVWSKIKTHSLIHKDSCITRSFDLSRPQKPSKPTQKKRRTQSQDEDFEASPKKSRHNSDLNSGHFSIHLYPSEKCSMSSVYSQPMMLSMSLNSTLIT